MTVDNVQSCDSFINDSVSYIYRHKTINKKAAIKLISVALKINTGGQKGYSLVLWIPILLTDPY
jgi:hypothetical protein